jgi:hypothetical protein
VFAGVQALAGQILPAPGNFCLCGQILPLAHQGWDLRNLRENNGLKDSFCVRRHWPDNCAVFSGQNAHGRQNDSRRP